MGLIEIESYLICIFMNINKHVENRGKNEVKAIAVPRFWMGYKIYLAHLTPIFMTISVVRRTTLNNVIKY